MAQLQAPEDLSSWLAHIERLHPKSIDMGLDRVHIMIERLKLYPNFRIITVAGTNGKGSTCAMMSQIYLQAGYQVGCYTSPHLLRYNERVRVGGVEVSDAALCEAFSIVDAARCVEHDVEIPLTYFEMGTLAAIWYFMKIGVDVAVLEVGLGGRLDAVNAFEPDCSVVTSIDLDHQEFLGETREEIGYEKAGVYRRDKPAICGDNSPPQSLIEYARLVEADLQCIHRDFNQQCLNAHWQFLVNGTVKYTLPLPMLKGSYQLNNASCAIAAIESLQKVLPVAESSMIAAMCQVVLAGRFQIVSERPRVILDVAHNPHAARALAQNLEGIKSATGKTVAVFAMLADKDIGGVVHAVKDVIDVWYVASVHHARGASASELYEKIAKIISEAKIQVFDSASVALRQACMDVNENDKIIVFGSFFTVADVMQHLDESINLHL
ncbi:MAG: bifunctional tetrahydrofolate synthase/dihydrofolate synthase [Betaproteobacteria bacterium]|nr:bifunctional tetrahydrofolate synthase/dihydrofolate synthase [Betaproteobacteria bacterium]